MRLAHPGQHQTMALRAEAPFGAQRSMWSCPASVMCPAGGGRIHELAMGGHALGVGEQQAAVHTSLGWDAANLPTGVARPVTITFGA
jgi:hypothetical protein